MHKFQSSSIHHQSNQTSLQSMAVYQNWCILNKSTTTQFETRHKRRVFLSFSLFLEDKYTKQVKLIIKNSQIYPQKNRVFVKS